MPFITFGVYLLLKFPFDFPGYVSTKRLFAIPAKSWSSEGTVSQAIVRDFTFNQQYNTFMYDLIVLFLVIETSAYEMK